MDNVEQFLFLMWALMIVSGIVLYKTYLLIVGISRQRQYRKIFPSIERIKDKEMCKGPHKWDSIKLIIAGLAPDSYTVCTECGFISTDGPNLRLNKAGLEVYKNELKIRKERSELLDQINKMKQQEIDRVMASLVRSFVTQFDGDINKNGEILQQFFRKSIIEMDAVYSKLNEELDKRRV